MFLLCLQCVQLSHFIHNIQPCPDGAADFREVQCAATDGVSFNGRFHAWELFTGQCTYNLLTLLLV